MPSLGSRDNVLFCYFSAYVVALSHRSGALTLYIGTKVAKKDVVSRPQTKHI